jgi:signal peptidase I
MAKTWKERSAHYLRQARSFLFVVLVVLSFRSSVADWNDVPTGSMKPSILEGDRIFVNKLAYDLKVPFTTWHLAQWDDPVRGEVVVFYSPADGIRLVKRVIGVPGDVLELRSNRLYVNGKMATYQPMDPAMAAEVARQMGPARATTVLETESLDGLTHPLMVMPFVYSERRDYGPTTVPAGKYFMMGDNRDNSNDSRFYGPVDRGQIVGRSSAIVLSLDPQHSYKPRWGRFFKSLP